MTERPRTLAKPLSTTTRPPQVAAWRDHPKLIADPHADRVVKDVGSDERALIVGAGLTAADLVAALDVPCLSRGRSFGELMGLPQVSDYAHFAAAQVVAAMSRTETRENAA